MISALVFDFGGTLDADGLHWLDRFYAIYADIGLAEIPKKKIKEAFYWADEQAELDPGMRSAELRPMMERHVHWQFQKLGLENQMLEARAAAAFYKPADRILRRNRHIFEKLSQAGLKLGIISNFYGNIEALCREFSLTPFLNVILDSAIVGLKKPDPKLLRWPWNGSSSPLKRSPSWGTPLRGISCRPSRSGCRRFGSSAIKTLFSRKPPKWIASSEVLRTCLMNSG